MYTTGPSKQTVQQAVQAFQNLHPHLAVSEVKIKYNTQGKASLFLYTVLPKVQRSARLEELLHKQGYQELLIKTEKGKIVFAQLTTKQRL